LQTYRRNAARRRVPTLLDLNDFTTLIFFNIAYNLYIFRQASRRSWRINQKSPRVEVYIFYYVGTMQHSAIRLMANKLAAATVIEGNISDEGLAAMSSCEDMTTALARELTRGIRNEVDDIADSFKKMAILKPKIQDVQPVPKEPGHIIDVVPTTSKTIQIPMGKQKIIPKTAAFGEQLTLFDLLAS